MKKTGEVSALVELTFYRVQEELIGFSRGDVCNVSSIMPGCAYCDPVSLSESGMFSYFYDDK